MFAIFGLPKSGTTIVNAFFDSLDNGFSISEPVAGATKTPNHLRFNKIQYPNIKNGQIIPAIEESLVNDKRFILGGIKEVYRHDEDIYDKVLEHLGLFDFFVFVFRDPRRIFSSWHQANWFHKYSQTSWLYHSYQGLYDLYKQLSHKKPVFAIKYEDFCCDNTIGYMNRVFDGYTEIVGKLQITPSDYILGDDRAIRSETIYPPSMLITKVAIHPPNMEYIKHKIMPIYNNIKDLQK